MNVRNAEAFVCTRCEKNECFTGHYKKEYSHIFLYGIVNSAEERLERMQDLEKGHKMLSSRYDAIISVINLKQPCLQALGWYKIGTLSDHLFSSNDIYEIYPIFHSPLLFGIE